MNREAEQKTEIEKLENHLRHWKKVAETEETKVMKLQELNRKLQKEVESWKSIAESK